MARVKIIAAVGAVPLAVGCGGSVADTSSGDSCSVPLEAFCMDNECPTSFDEEVRDYQAKTCTSEILPFELPIARGCGLVWLAPIFRELAGVRHVWFRSEDGDLAGMATGSSRECAMGITYAGAPPPEQCRDVVYEPCGICGWNVCEQQVCHRQVYDCGFVPECMPLRACAESSGCRGADCLDTPSCSGPSDAGAPPSSETLARMEAMVDCVANAGCPVCPRSLGLPPVP